jgi:hypothetical protein
LNLKRGWHLALNARGTVMHALGDFDSARKDFADAASARPDFVDAYISRGTLSVYRGEARGVSKWFEKASEMCPKCVLVINGRGSAAYGKGLWDEAEKYFASIPKDSVATTLAQHNIEAVNIARSGKNIVGATDAGTPILALPKGEGGRLPQPRPPDRDPKPPHGPTPPRPGPKPGPPGPEQPPVGPPWPSPPVWKPQPGPPPLPDDPNPPRWPVPGGPLPSMADPQSPSPPVNIPGPKLPPPGGVDPAPIREPRTNIGNWTVFAWYGLAYDVPVKAPFAKSQTAR